MTTSEEVAEGPDENVVKPERLNRITPTDELAQRDWDRDNLDRFFEMVENNVKSIENWLGGLNDEIESIPSEEELDERWKAHFDEKDMDIENKERNDEIPVAYWKARGDKLKAYQRMEEWHAELYEQLWFAVRVFDTKFKELLEEYRKAKSWDSLQDMVQDVAVTEDDFRDEIQEIRTLRNELEKAMQSLREERKVDRRVNKELASSVKGVDEQRIMSLVEQGAREGIESFTDGNQVVTFNPDKRELDRKNEEREDAAETVAESEAEEVVDETSTQGNQSSGEETDDWLFDSDGKYDLKGKSVSEKADVLVELWDRENIREKIDDDEVNKSDVTELTNVSQATLFNSGLFERLEEQEEVFLPTP